MPHVISFSWSDFQRQQSTQQTRYHRSSVPNRSWTSRLARYSSLGCRMEGSVPFSDLVLSHERWWTDSLRTHGLGEAVVLFCFMIQVLGAQSGDGWKFNSHVFLSVLWMSCSFASRLFDHEDLFFMVFFRKQLLAEFFFFPSSSKSFFLFPFFPSFYLS